MSSSISASASASASSGGSLSVGESSNPAFKVVGISLAISSGAFIGASFVVKKLGLIRATRESGGQAGEGHAYLKSWIWWIGMTMMIIGEIANFVAYAFTEAILVTPMGALSVVICAILSHFFLKESLNFFGWIGCTLCIIGATILALNAPEQQSVTTISAFKKLFLSPGFLVWGSLCIAISLGIIFFVAPRWGKTNMMPYIGVCSLIGGISVSCTQGLGASIVTSIGGNNQVKNWFFWFLFVFVVITLLVEINYLNKALELFNAAMVVPVYFVTFTSATLITSFILYQGLKASAITLITMVLGFFVICLGITLLQMSKVDPKQLTKLGRKATIFLEATNRPTEESEKGNVSALEEPGMDALRGGFGAVGSIIRARSVSRRLSNASNYGQIGHHNSASNLSTHGLGQLQRFQLSDNPMPEDAADRISQHARSPIERTTSFAHSLFPQRSKSSLRFEEEDVVHQYGYGRNDDAYHHYQQHPHSAPPLMVTNAMRSPGMGNRQGSTSSVYPPVLEEPETDEPEEMEKPRSYLDPYTQTSSTQLSKNPSKHATSPGHGGKFANMFHFSSSHDPSKQDVRGGAHRGMEDYPRLRTRDYATEHEERAGLVGSGRGHAAQESIDEDQQRQSYEDEPRSAVTDESFGHVLQATRRPGPVITTRPPTDYEEDGGATPRGSSPWGR